ncbi:MAG: ribbon-helix-helix protein, CopG family [Actinobacteria bacterium]|nr:ribbon-helix-helix protein, CopG family [Actinomycetota bacterium]
MGRMVRKQLNLEEDLDQALAERASELGISQSELVRRAIETFLAQSQRDEGIAALERLRAMWDEDDRLGIGSGPEGRTWTREELHDRWERHHGHERVGLRGGRERAGEEAAGETGAGEDRR